MAIQGGPFKDRDTAELTGDEFSVREYYWVDGDKMSAVTDPDLPAIGDVYSGGHRDLKCIAKRALPIPHGFWTTVEVEYSTRNDSLQGPGSGDPNGALPQNPSIEFQVNVYSETTSYGFTGRNNAGLLINPVPVPYNGTLNVLVASQILQVTHVVTDNVYRNVRSARWRAVVRSLNNAAFLGANPASVLYYGFTSRQDANTRDWTVTHKWEQRIDKFAPSGRVSGWDEVITLVDQETGQIRGTAQPMLLYPLADFGYAFF